MIEVIHKRTETFPTQFADHYRDWGNKTIFWENKLFVHSYTAFILTWLNGKSWINWNNNGSVEKILNQMGKIFPKQ